MSRTLICRSTVLAAACAIPLMAAPAATAATRYVDDDGGQCPRATFTSVQPAIDASGPGDAVVVCNGTYTGAVRIGPGKDRLRLTSQVRWGATLTPTPGGAPVIVDVRAPGERQQKRIPGSVGIPLNHLVERLQELPADRQLLVHCAGGYRSSIAASLLQRHGFTQAGEIAGGIAAWDAAKLPLET